MSPTHHFKGRIPARYKKGLFLNLNFSVASLLKRAYLMTQAHQICSASYVAKKTKKTRQKEIHK